MNIIDLKDHISVYPIVKTGKRWPVRREGLEIKGSFDVFEKYPQLKEDPRYSDYGSCPDNENNPVVGSFGGGFFPTLGKTPDGKLICAFRTGAAHRKTLGGQISITVSNDRGKTWSDYRVLVEKTDGDSRNSSLGIYDNNIFVIAYGVFGEDEIYMESIRTTDGGKIWSEPKRINKHGIESWQHPHGQMLRLDNGKMVFMSRGSYMEEQKLNKPPLPDREAYLFWSNDEGKTFSKFTFLAPKSETSFLPLEGNNWISYTRTHFSKPQIGRSFDGGKTWEGWDDAYPNMEPPKNLGNFGAPGTILKLPSGKILIVHTYRLYPFGIRAVVSKDGGKTFDWEKQYVLEDSYWTYDSGYPSTVCFDDGTIVTVAYTVLDMDHPEWGTCAIAYVYNEMIFE